MRPSTHVRALLFSLGLEATSHAGTHNLLYMHLVRPGTIPVCRVRIDANSIVLLHTSET